MINALDVLWRGIEDVFNAIMRHPFIVGLRTGDLPIDVFKYYLVQDYLYLREFSRVLRILASKAPLSDWRVKFERDSRGVIEVEEELLHKPLLTRLGIDESHLSKAMSPTTYAYTRHLLHSVNEGFIEGLASVTPCYWVYQRVAWELSRQGVNHGIYSKWVSFYVSDRFMRSTDEVLNIVSNALLSVGEDALGRVLVIFRLSAVYEFMFWDAAYNMESWPLDPRPPKRLVT